MLSFSLFSSSIISSSIKSYLSVSSFQTIFFLFLTLVDSYNRFNCSASIKASIISCGISPPCFKCLVNLLAWIPKSFLFNFWSFFLNFNTWCNGNTNFLSIWSPGLNLQATWILNEWEFSFISFHLFLECWIILIYKDLNELL